MKKLLSLFVLLVFLMWWISLSVNYTSEQQDAYKYAYSKNITTVSSIEKADINGSLTRIAMAKMVSNFAINVLWLQPDTSKNCSFSDVPKSLDADYNYGVTQACQLWLMWMWSNWKKSDKFDPYGTVTRGQFGTAFSRALSKANGENVSEWTPYYKSHLEYLNRKGIINNVNSPSSNSYEKRWNVMIMMNRYDKWGNSNKWNQQNNNQNVKDDGFDGKDWVQTLYYDNWKVWKILTYKDGKLNWQYVEYFQDGSVASKWSYKNWELDGYWIRYCEEWNSNCTSLDGNYKNGEKVRWVEEYWTFNTYAYWSNEQIQNAAFYDNDWELNGDYISFYENWQIKERWQYKSNKKEWEWIEYFQDGSVASKWSYKNWELDGYWIRYCEKWNSNCISLDGNYENWEKIRDD